MESGFGTADARREGGAFGNAVWWVRFSGRWLYLYLLLEFQSTVDPFMAVRLLTYLGLLYQDLIKQRALANSGRLPPMLPIVLYNGKPRWTAATELLNLIELAPGRLPGVSLPEVSDLLEIKTMLAESVQEWTQDWKQQGLVEGWREGESALLERLLIKRFGSLDAETRHRLQAATSEQLETWGERILDARKLSDVFAED